MTLQGPEPLITALRQRLVDDLPGHVTTVNGEVTDGTTIVSPDAANILDYLPSVGELVNFPTVAIEHGPGRFEDDTGHEATGVYDLVVVAFVQDADPQRLARVVRRTHRAVMRTVLAGRAIGSGSGAAWGVTLNSFDFGPALTRRERGDAPPDTYMTWVAMSIRCRIDES